MRILILGCGWIGEEILRHYLHKGYEVVTTNRSIEKVEQNRSVAKFAYQVDFDHQVLPDHLGLRDFDFVLNSIPASKKMTLEQIKNRFSNVADFLKTLSYTRHIYLSSIGIYPDVPGDFDESFNDFDVLHPALAAAEDLLLPLDNTVVFRLGGLFGKSRIFAKYFANKVMTNGEELANFIHQDDVVHMVSKAFLKDKLGANIFNVVAPEHPKKKDVVNASAYRYGFDLPSSYEPISILQKRIIGERIVRDLDYTFVYPDPLTF